MSIEELFPRPGEPEPAAPTILHGNAGEWSEAYAWCRLLADGMLDLADADLNALVGRSQQLTAVVRGEGTAFIRHELVSGEVVSIDTDTGTKLARTPVAQIRAAGLLILKAIKDGTGRQVFTPSTFGIPSVEGLLREHGFISLKARSQDKADIQVLRLDPRAPGAAPEGYSVKSRLGKASTLLNPGIPTNFRFEVSKDGAPPAAEVIGLVNSIDEKPRLARKLKALEDLGFELNFVGVRGTVFTRNLEVVDSRMPELLANALLVYYGEGVGAVSAVVARLDADNPLGFDQSDGHQFYAYKMKRLLQDVALGMLPESAVWDGIYHATAGYIIVREDGGLVAYNLYNLNEFQDYLYSNTKFEKPGEDRCSFGTLYEEDSRVYIDLCLQIRFKG